MSKLLSIAFFALLSISLVFAKKSRGIGADCDLFHWCDKGLDCFDYRCDIAIEGKKDNEVKWTPKGPKCDWFHYCPKNYKCKQHRCISTKDKKTQLKTTK
jgi:hypothetical protein